MTTLAALYPLWSLFAVGQYLLVLLDALIIVAVVFMMLESTAALVRERRVHALALTMAASSR